MKAITCCVTGHRDLPEHAIYSIRSRLEAQIDEAIADGYRIFISGFAQGADLLFADIVAQRCRRSPELQLEAAIPYRARYNALMSGPATRQLLACCSAIYVLSEQYGTKVFSRRNRYMVERSSRVIGIYDGRSGGGTAATIAMARAGGCDVRTVLIHEDR